MSKVVYVLIPVEVPENRDLDDFLDECEFKCVNTHDNEDYIRGVECSFDSCPTMI